MALQMNEVLTCKPSRFGLHEWVLKRRSGQYIMTVRGIFARTGQAAANIGHAVMDGKCDMLKLERVAA
jgi:hypothetical protein